jgi:hypothetical protein
MLVVAAAAVGGSVAEREPKERWFAGVCKKRIAALTPPLPRKLPFGEEQVGVEPPDDHERQREKRKESPGLPDKQRVESGDDRGEESRNEPDLAILNEPECGVLKEPADRVLNEPWGVGKVPGASGSSSFAAILQRNSLNAEVPCCAFVLGCALLCSTLDAQA